jgi:hypothetical protein
MADAWNGTLGRDKVVLTPTLFAKLDEAESRAVSEGCEPLREFLEASVDLK